MAPTPKHILISYARADRHLVERLLRDLHTSGFPTWVDDNNIEPGTYDWEHAIRGAVSESYAVVLVCTPNTTGSQYIQAELALAQKHGITIVPVWMSGDEWVDCIPLGFVRHQHIDCRERSSEDGVARLVRRLQAIVAARVPKLSRTSNPRSCPPGFIPIIMPKEDGGRLDLFTAARADHAVTFGRDLPERLEVVAVDPSAYSTFEALLHDVYTEYLRARFNPYTYGRDWALVKASDYVSLLALPWEWMRNKRDRPLVDVIPNYVRRETPLAAFGLGMKPQWHPQSNWAIIDSGFERACGLFTSSSTVAKKAFDPVTKGLSFQLRRCDKKRLADLDPARYEYKLVIVPDRFSMGDANEPLPSDTVFVV